MENSFEYYAFISYKREDEKWARWLQNKLEAYKLPAVIRKEIPRLPKRIRPIFRDKTDLGAGMLTDSLAKELERSRFLIVICSPESAKSDWVGREITTFAGMGRAECIIPFIVDGEPNSGNEQECFHPVIKATIPETLGININEIGKEQAFIKVAAKLLDLRFDALWNRFLRERRKYRLAAAALALLFLAGAGFVWDYFRTKLDYYADYVDRWGIPEGVVQLGRTDIAKRNNYYRFESSQRKLRRVVHANSAGMAVEHTDTEQVDRPAIQEFIYADADNRLITTELKNAKGKTIASYSWGSSSRDGKNLDRIDIKQSKENGSGAALASSFTSMSNLFSTQSSNIADIKRFKLTRDDRGYIVRKEFKQDNGNDAVAACDASGVWGFEYDLDNLGRPIEVRYLGSDGQYLLNKTGVMGKKYEYDKYGNIKRIEYFGKDEKPVLNEQLWAICLSVSDDNGNCTEVTCFGADGNPCLVADSYARNTAKYDERGNVIEEAYFGADGNPCLHKDGYAKWTAKYDERGNMVEASYFGVDGNPCLHRDNYTKWTAKYDERGNMIEVSYFGADGNPCLTADGYSKWTAKYDERGNMIEASYFDTGGNPCLHNEGYTKYTAKYDERGNLAEASCFGTNGSLCVNTYNYAKFTAQYDERGNRIEQAFFGADGNPCLHKDGYAKWTAVYDEAGYSELKKYGLNDELVTAPTVVGAIMEGGAAWQKGLRGSMPVLEYCDWKFGNTRSDLTKLILPNRDKDKTLVVLNSAGKIEQYHFVPGLIGVRFDSEEISGVEYYHIEKLYNEWKKSQ